MAVFAVDKDHKSLMPCSEKRGGIQSLYPFTIRLVDRAVEESRHTASAGSFSTLESWHIPTQKISCMGRGFYQRTRNDRYGFPRGSLTRQKQVHGFQTADYVKAEVPQGKKQGSYSGRGTVRASGNFTIQTEKGVVEGISWKHGRLMRRGKGFSEATTEERVFLPPLKRGGGLAR